MTPLAKAVLKAATTALAHRGTVPVTGHALSDCREDARAVAVSVQVAVGDAMARPGLHPFTTRQAHELLALADDLDRGGSS
jgi:hypothetical protein